jgi:predicted TIM-barrel fold metal-dependent hydrolase
MLVVDAHCHLPQGFTARELETAFSLGFVDEVWALSAPLTHWTGVRDNDEVVLELARDLKGKIIPFGYLQLAEGPDWVDRQKGRGFVGLKAHTPPRPWDDDSFFPIYQRAEALGMPILFHTGQAWADTLDHYPHAAGHRSRSTDWMHVERLDVVIKQFPSLTVIAAHFGWPHCEAAMGMALTHPNFFLDTSGYIGVFLDAVARAMTVHGIASKMLMGTDINLLTPEGQDHRGGIRTWQERVLFWRHYFTQVFPQPGAAELVLGGNARGIVAGLPAGRAPGREA